VAGGLAFGALVLLASFTTLLQRRT
jgi:hypothetical protein